MSDLLRPRRSVLYMPGANERALEKAKALPADALILDLEDAVAPDAKAEARDRVCSAAASGEYGPREITIRVNSLDTEWHADDVRAVAEAGPAGMVVPKVGSAADVHQVEKAL
jgi:citrate lyase subunit beta / citryl-CoA lyase